MEKRALLGVTPGQVGSRYFHAKFPPSKCLPLVAVALKQLLLMKAKGNVNLDSAKRGNIRIGLNQVALCLHSKRQNLECVASMVGLFCHLWALLHVN
jgi:hypothetical protein